MSQKNSIVLHPIGDEKKASEAIYEQIRQLIREGEILPGSRLPSERKMMEMVGKSRSSVREAMRMLQRDGYIETVSRSSGAIVLEPGVAPAVEFLESVICMQGLKIQEVQEFRRQTENTSAAFAALRRTSEDLDRMRQILEKAEASIGHGAEFIACDLEFHLAVAEAAKNSMYVIMFQVCQKVLGEQLGKLLTKGTVKQQKERYENILNAHKELYFCIRDGKKEDASRLMETHLIYAEKDIWDLSPSE